MSGQSPARPRHEGPTRGSDRASRTATFRAARWVDDRLGGASFARTTLNKVFPDHWSFMIGELVLYSFIVLVVTGVYRALAEVGALGDLTGTVYGRVLLVKLGLFAGMLVLGGYNRFVVHPRLERAALGLPGGDAAATRLLGRSIRAELGFAAALIATVGILVSTAPPG